MQSYQDLVALARLCWRQANLSQTKDVADELRRMAVQYQQQAAKLDGGKLPDIGAGRSEPLV
jgi:hypothetical protein